MMKHIKKLIVKSGKHLCALALMTAPVVAQSCRFCFYEPEVPEGMDEFAARKRR